MAALCSQPILEVIVSHHHESQRRMPGERSSARQTGPTPVSLLTMLACMLALGIALPATAHAAAPGTIVYIRNNNVWIAKGDGSAQVAVTTNGGTALNRYHSPSMSDNGVISVLRGNNLMRLRTNGEVLSSFDTGRLLPTAVVQNTADAQASPSGARVSYTLSAWQGPGYSVRSGVRYSTANGSAYVGQQQLFRRQAHWLSESRVVMSDGVGLHVHDIASETTSEWFTPEIVHESYKYEGMRNPAISRNGAWVAATVGEYAPESEVMWFKVNGSLASGVPAAPTFTCKLTPENPTDELDHPTFAPDGSAIAWQEATGVWIKPNPAACNGDGLRLLLPGGGDPFWSKATYSIPPRAGSGTTKPKPKSKAKALKAKAAPKVSGKAKVGRTLKVGKGKWNAKPKKIGYQWYRGKKKIKGATKAKYRVKRADRGKRLRVKVTVKRSGYKAASKFTKYTAKVKR